VYWRLLALFAVALVVGTGVRAHGRSGAREQAVWVFYDSKLTSTAAIRSKIANHGGTVRFASNWLHAVSADLTTKQQRALRRVAGVTRMVPVAKLYTMSAPAPDATKFSAQQDSSIYGPNFGALRELGVPAAHALNFTGRGVRIAIIDTGFNTGHEALATLNVIARKDFIHGDNNVGNQPGDSASARNQELHGTRVWSILGGNRPGRIRGPAYQADFILAKVDIEQLGEDVRADEDRWVQAVEWAVDSAGARIINSSLAYRTFVDKPDYQLSDLNGDSAVSTVVADRLARAGVLVVNAVGNSGPTPGSLWAPADGDSVIAVGAIDSLGQVAPFSSRGRTFDGRIKPDLVARGVRVYAADPRLADPYDYFTGTSEATPFIAGIAAMFMQAWPTINNMGVFEALRISTGQTIADENRGWGLPNVASAIVWPQGITTTAADVATINPATSTLLTVAPTFRWNPGSTLQTVRPLYRLELATDAAMSRIIYSDTTSLTAITVRQPIPPTPAIWWRVSGDVFPGIRRAAPVQGPIIMPDWVRLLNLNETTPQFVNTTRPQFLWESLLAPTPIGPFTFQLQIIDERNNQVVQDVRDLSTASFTLRESLTPNLRYRWRVIARLPSVNAVDTVTSIGTFVVTSTTQPPSTLLYPPFPNPFPRPDINGGLVLFWFDLSERTQVELSIHDLRGRLIRRLIPSQPSCGTLELDAGQFGRGAGVEDPCQVTSWDGLDLRGQRVPRGVYLARLRTSRGVQTQRILFNPQ
jgi:subtilisin family serine protease